MDWGTPHDVPIRVGDFLTMDFREKHYDAITAWALLEHVRAPSAFFKRVSQLLKDDGILVFAVPNFDRARHEALLHRRCSRDTSGCSLRGRWRTTWGVRNGGASCAS